MDADKLDTLTNQKRINEIERESIYSRIDSLHVEMRFLAALSILSALLVSLYMLVGVWFR